MSQTKNDIRLEGVKYFLEAMEAEMEYIQKENPVKKRVMENLDQWLNTIENIKGIIDYGTI
jgi:hypothetical protein|tara:strand:+ start:94 stop:276 length:183 start_codon:yes stop_codon:yes gene_type:complete